MDTKVSHTIAKINSQNKLRAVWFLHTVLAGEPESIHLPRFLIFYNILFIGFI